jgi:hypothetical protein
MKTIRWFSILAAISVSLIVASRGPAACKDDRIIFQGEVLEIGPSPGYGSGGVQAYQLVKYRVDNVCEGTYEAGEIIVDHLLLDPDELKDLRVGDTVCVGVVKVKKISSRWNDGKLRKDTDKVNAYYVALDVLIRNCQCQRPQ